MILNPLERRLCRLVTSAGRSQFLSVAPGTSWYWVKAILLLWSFPFCSYLRMNELQVGSLLTIWQRMHSRLEPIQHLVAINRNAKAEVNQGTQTWAWPVEMFIKCIDLQVNWWLNSSPTISGSVRNTRVDVLECSSINRKHYNTAVSSKYLPIININKSNQVRLDYPRNWRKFPTFCCLISQHQQSLFSAASDPNTRFSLNNSRNK